MQLLIIRAYRTWIRRYGLSEGGPSLDILLQGDKLQYFIPIIPGLPFSIVVDSTNLIPGMDGFFFGIGINQSKSPECVAAIIKIMFRFWFPVNGRTQTSC